MRNYYWSQDIKLGRTNHHDLWVVSLPNGKFFSIGATRGTMRNMWPPNRGQIIPGE